MFMCHFAKVECMVLTTCFCVTLVHVSVKMVLMVPCLTLVLAMYM